MSRDKRKRLRYFLMRLIAESDAFQTDYGPAHGSQANLNSFRE